MSKDRDPWCTDDPTEQGYKHHMELMPADVLDASFIGIGQIPVADVLGAASAR